MRAYLVEHLGDPGAVLVIDETGDLKKAPPRLGCNAGTPAPPSQRSLDQGVPARRVRVMVAVDSVRSSRL
jgi:hypothetical protein